MREKSNDKSEITKVEKPGKISKKKRRFAAMIGGSTAGDSAAITPMQEAPSIAQTAMEQPANEGL